MILILLIFSFLDIKLNQTNERRELALVANEASETAELGSGVKSFEMNINLTAPQNTVAPMLDLQRSSVSLINNIIDKIISKNKKKFKIILTGGYVDFFKRVIKKNLTVDQDITVKGVANVYKELI